ncbi:HepT-like ribonuclease domain-containing protein [Pyrobaculum sp.]|uniref:HepT-like ribonuclease domain-containing protein n=1 Tax=Pyrobaculum sp. TaxID=2004705 RepID=UPI0031641947
MRLREQLARVRRYAELLAERLEAGGDIFALERLAELVAQSTLDLAAMWLAAERGEKPATYREVARFLAKKVGGYEDFLVRLAAFRNIIVHGYYSLDEKRELEAFREIAAMMPDLLNAVESKLPDDPCIGDLKGLEPVFEKHGVEYAVVFGSLAKKGCGRDVDLAVKFREEKGLWGLAALVADVADALGLDYGQVDVVDVDAALPALLLSVLEGVPIYNAERAREDLTWRYIELLDVGETWEYANRRISPRPRS